MSKRTMHPISKIAAVIRGLPFTRKLPGRRHGEWCYRVTRFWEDGLIESGVFPHSGYWPAQARMTAALQGLGQEHEPPEGWQDKVLRVVRKREGGE